LGIDEDHVRGGVRSIDSNIGCVCAAIRAVGRVSRVDSDFRAIRVDRIDLIERRIGAGSSICRDILCSD